MDLFIYNPLYLKLTAIYDAISRALFCLGLLYLIQLLRKLLGTADYMSKGIQV